MMQRAARQKALVTRPELLALGMTGSAIDERVRAGELTVVHRGVYLVGPLMPPGATELAAVLACSPDAYASHETATGLHALPLPAPPTSVHVTVIGRSVKRRGITVHRVRALPDDETWILDGIPVTSPARSATRSTTCGRS